MKSIIGGGVVVSNILSVPLSIWWDADTQASNGDPCNRLVIGFLVLSFFIEFEV